MTQLQHDNYTGIHWQPGQPLPDALTKENRHRFVLLLDLDGTSRDTKTLINRELSTLLGREVEPHEQTGYRAQNLFPHLHDQLNKQLLEKCFPSFEWIRDLPPHGCIQKVITDIQEHCQVVILTDQVPGADQATLLWLAHHQFPVQEVIFCKGNHKHLLALECRTADRKPLIAEDHPEIIAEALQHHIPVIAYLFDRPWSLAIEAIGQQHPDYFYPIHPHQDWHKGLEYVRQIIGPA